MDRFSVSVLRVGISGRVNTRVEWVLHGLTWHEPDPGARIPSAAILLLGQVCWRACGEKMAHPALDARLNTSAMAIMICNTLLCMSQFRPPRKLFDRQFYAVFVQEMQPHLQTTGFCPS